MNPAHVQWSRNVFAMLKDGGIWSVPRSGLVFRRDGDRLTLVTKDDLTPFMAADLAAITAHFKAAGVEVVAG